MFSLPPNAQYVMIITVVILFITVFIWTFFTVFSITATNDNATNMINAMSKVVIANTIMVMVFAGLAFFYVNTYPAMKHPYMMFLLHLNLLISISAIGISALYTI